MILLYPWWLLLALFFGLAYLLFKTSHRNDWLKVIPEPVYRYLSGSTNSTGYRQPSLLIASLVCIALSSPATESRDTDTYRHAQGWIIIADVSRSMTLNDVAPSRLAAMRNTAIDLAERAGAYSTSLIVFAGDAFIVAPPSFDNEFFKSNVSLLSHGVVPLEGSNLTRAMSLAWSVIEDSNLVGARLFLLSDTGGFNNRSDAAIARLASHGHRTDVIVFGNDGATTSAPYDLRFAKILAQSGNGQLLQADAIGQVNLSKLDLDKNISDRNFLTHSGLTSIQWRNQSHWLLLLAILPMLWLFLRERRT